MGTRPWGKTERATKTGKYRIRRQTERKVRNKLGGGLGFEEHLNQLTSQKRKEDNFLREQRLKQKKSKPVK